MFGWAVAKHELAASPMQNMKPPAKIVSRERALSDQELRLVWLGAEALGWPFGPIIHLLILTGQRRDEVAGLRWPEIDMVAKRWLLPAERSKNGEENLVPLSPEAFDILRSLPAVKIEPSSFSPPPARHPSPGFRRSNAD